MGCGESRAGGGVSCFHDRFTMSLTALQNLTSLEGFQGLTHVQFFYFNHSLLHHSRRPTVSHANSPSPPLLLRRALHLLPTLTPNKTRERNAFDTNSFPTLQSVYQFGMANKGFQELSIAVTALKQNRNSSRASKPSGAGMRETRKIAAGSLTLQSSWEPAQARR